MTSGDNDLSSATTDSLTDRDVKKDSRDASIGVDLRAAELVKRRQANKLREWFFWLAACLAVATVVTSVVLVLSVTIGGSDITPAVAVAFISGLAVETVGVLAVMAGYLFPRNGDESK